MANIDNAIMTVPPPQIQPQQIDPYPPVDEKNPLDARLEQELDVPVNRESEDGRQSLYTQMDMVENPYSCDFHRKYYEQFLSDYPPAGTCGPHATNLCMYVGEKTPGGNPYMRRAGKFTPKNLPPMPPALDYIFTMYPKKKTDVKRVSV
jgi:hypothetical protein